MYTQLQGKVLFNKNFLWNTPSLQIKAEILSKNNKPK